MTLEEIKEWLSKCEPTEHTKTTFDVIEWLIAEVEMYQKIVAGNSQLQIDWIDVTAKRCAEIAGETSKVAEHRIKVEFNP